ncbi:MAG: RIP metalloprotease RseP [Pseudomonadota bacterium]
MNLIQTLLAFFVVIGVLIIVHELGHYWIARWCGVKVLRFSVGMGKVVYSRRIGPDQTEWALSMLPFGGYVKMLDARDQDLAGLPESDLKREFTRQNVWKRIAIVAAGPIANFLLAIALFSGLFMHGIPEPIPKLRAMATDSVAYQAGLRGGETITAVNGEPIRIWSDLRWKLLQAAVEKQSVKLEVERPVAQARNGATVDTKTVDAKVVDVIQLPLDSITAKDMETDFLQKLGLDLARPKATLGKVVEGGPAMRAGLRENDLVLAINGETLTDGLRFLEVVRESAGKPLAMQISRDGAIETIDVTPVASVQQGKSIGRIQVEMPLMPEMTVADDPPLAAIAKGAQKTWDTSVLTLKMVGKMITGEVSIKNVTGPITIADYAGQTARIGLVSYLSFIALISISLGVMNLLPIPVLDGGHLLYYSVEVFTGKPIPERFGEMAQRAGAGILMTLMVVAVFNDIVRLMS